MSTAPAHNRLGPGDRGSGRCPDSGRAPVSVRPRPRSRLDHLYKRALIGSDVLSGVAALVVIRAISGGRLLQWDLLTALLIVLLAKLLGRYDGHNAVIRRSVLNEVPALVILAAVWALMWSLLSIPLQIHTGVGRGGTGLLWLILAAVLILSRSAAHLGRHPPDGARAHPHRRRGSGPPGPGSLPLDRPGCPHQHRGIPAARG